MSSAMSSGVASNHKCHFRAMLLIHCVVECTAAGPLLCGMYSCWSLALWSVQLLVPCFVECTAAGPLLCACIVECTVLVPCFVECTAAGPLLCGVYSCWSPSFVECTAADLSDVAS